MSLSRSFLQFACGSDASVGQLLRYWAVGLALYAVSLLMLWMTHADAKRYPPQEELAYFVIAATMLSAGLAESAAGESIDAAFEPADKARYRARREGRDRIVCALHPATRAAAGAAYRPAPSIRGKGDNSKAGHTSACTKSVPSQRPWPVR